MQQSDAPVVTNSDYVRQTFLVYDLDKVASQPSMR
jgi:hypothetical protein